MAQTKNQKREKVLAKLEKELQKFVENRIAVQRISTFLIRPSIHEWRLETEINNIRRNMGKIS